MKIGQWLHKLAVLSPILNIIGVKKGTVVAKAGDVIVIVDKVVNEEKKKNGS